MKIKQFLSVRKAIVAALLFVATPAHAEVQWEIAKGRSTVEFRVKHFVLLDVKGRFKDYEATVITTDENNFAGAKVVASIPISSIYTGNEDRDSHLLQEDFFHIDKYPYMNFKSTSVLRTGKNSYDMHGVIGIRGVSMPITFKVIHQGVTTSTSGSTRAKFVATATLNRYDFGLRWNKATETGGIVVDNTVNISMKVIMTKQE